MADKARRRRSTTKPARDVQFSIRLTASEYDEVKRAADALVFDVSSYARSILLRAVREMDAAKKPSARKKRGAL